jgi:hypothetical protein
MGLLDDAIRDHLDLKRRRGADPAEVERAEREALGPVRRAPLEPAEGELELGPPAHDEYLEDGEHVSSHVEWEAPYDLHDSLDHEPIEPEPFDSGLPASQPLTREPFATEAPATESSITDPVAAVPAEPLTPEPTPPPIREAEPYEPAEDVEPPAGDLFERAELAGDATVEYDVERELGPEEGGAESEDVLEETPEFLQDTPDHDRLWFEQKPPKDFDFDG